MKKEDLHLARRSEILDVAQRLIATKGYEQMTIADIQAELGISKGAFYHYFELEGLSAGGPDRADAGRGREDPDAHLS